MNVCVFVGPTIDRQAVQATLECLCLPPAAQGDVYRAMLHKPRALGIIDGYFHLVPSVWHKEILWAMSQGVHVFGSASMGALRAAELHRYGMRGVGRIFQQFRDGHLEDDDEVAVLHGPEETAFRVLSEPMVNIRETLARAADDQVISTDTERTLVQAAKRTYYQERSWEALLGQWQGLGLLEDERETLEGWLVSGRTDLKRHDALQMLNEMRNFLAADPDSAVADYHFEWTHLWDAVTTNTVVADHTHSVGTAVASHALLLDELRLDPDCFERTRRDALLRRLIVKHSELSLVIIRPPGLLSEILQRLRSLLPPIYDE